jgi:transcriptional regulator with XRE-family HTH domain
MSKRLRKPTQQITKILAGNIRTYRRSRNLSQEELAEICGLHRTYVGSVERGERNVTLSTLEAFSAALGVSVQDLLKRKSTRDDSTHH